LASGSHEKVGAHASSGPSWGAFVGAETRNLPRDVSHGFFQISVGGNTFDYEADVPVGKVSLVGLSEVQPFFAQVARKLLGIQEGSFGSFSALQNLGGLSKISEGPRLRKGNSR
jgi:hypothetical protein